MKMQKRQFRIGELAKHLAVERFVIRFWEKEFGVKSHRSPGGQRFYSEQDLQKFKRIKELLYDRGFTIAGAKKMLQEKNSDIIASKKTTLVQINQPSALPKKVNEKLINIQQQLLKLKELL